MQSEPTIADIQQAFLEYQAEFKEPPVGLWFGARQGDFIFAMHKALSPWNVGLDNITWNQAPKNAREIQVTFGVPMLSASIQVSLWGMYMSALNVDWSSAQQIILLFQTALDALKKVVGQQFQSQRTTLGFHVKPGAKPFRETLAQFVNPKVPGSENATMFGVSAYSPEFTFIIDASLVFQQGLFIKLIRSFPAASRVEEMARTIHLDEETVLRSVGLKLQ
jgi:hypothetical protein